MHEKYPAMGLDSLYHFLKPTFGASRALLHRLMKKYNIHSVRMRAYKMTTNSKHNKPVSPNLLKNPDLKIDAPNTVWVVTYIPTQEACYCQRPLHQKSRRLRFFGQDKFRTCLSGFEYGCFASPTEVKFNFSFGSRQSVRIKYVP